MTDGSEGQAEDVANGIGYRLGWLRAAVLGSQDGIVSTASLIVGVAALDATGQSVLTAGMAGLFAGALSMAAGEYVSVSSQRDAELALRQREMQLTDAYPDVALSELAIALQLRGIDPGLARRVAQQISAVHPVDASVRVKYGISEALRARPLQAAVASAASFAAGAAVPLLGLSATTPSHRIGLAVGLALIALGACGAVAADVGGASRYRAALRVLVGGGLAMAIASLIGRLLGTVI